MATKYECDRCLKQEMSPLETITNDAEIYSDRIKKDLCGICIKQLRDWLKPLPTLEVKK